MIIFVRILGPFVVSFITIVVYIAGFANPVFAPVKSVKILGANSWENSQIQEMQSYTLDDQINPPDIKSTSYLVKNLTTDQILYKKYSHNPLPIASLTKLMTAWVVLKHGSLDDTYTITNSDTENISPVLGLRIGDTVKVNDLVHALLIGSANDSAMALGGYIKSKTGKDISTLMNAEAKNLGLSDSRYQNPIGFDSDNNYSSAEDVALLVKKLKETGIFVTTQRANSYSFKSAEGKPYEISATNKLIAKYNDLNAVKTGFTNLALGSMVTTLTLNGEEYLIVVIGSSDREGDTLLFRKLILEK